MTIRPLLSLPIASWLILIALSLPTRAATPFQLISSRGSDQAPPAGANGDSCLPILSPDGRFVLFASTANNLVMGNNELPVPFVTPAPLNVYLRDRSNAVTILVSVSASGTGGGNADSVPAGLSSDGRYALFTSSASNLIAGDTNAASDVFLRDCVEGRTVLVSANTNGFVRRGASRSAVMTPDARYVAFVSAAGDLVPDDVNGIPDVFVRDLQSNSTVMVSVGALGPVATASSEAPEITPDGRFVAFSSTATNLVSGVQSTGELYVRDLVTATSYWASAYALTALNANFGTKTVSYNHCLSTNGRYLAYQASVSSFGVVRYNGCVLRYDLETGATDVVHTNASFFPLQQTEDIRNLDMTPDGRRIAFLANTDSMYGTNCVLVWDADTVSLTPASSDLSGEVPTNAICDRPLIDPSGRYVLFLSDAANLVTNAVPPGYQIYERDLQGGTTRLVSADTNGVGVPLSYATAPVLAAEARLVAFESPDGALVPNDSNGYLDLFISDLENGSTEMVSVHHPASISLAENGSSSVSANAVSADGRCVVFTSQARIIGTEPNGFHQVYVRDLATGSCTLISADIAGLPGNSISTEPCISADGRYVAFSSYVTNFVTGDTNRFQDVFVRDIQSGTTTLVSRRADRKGAANMDSFSPMLSADGRYVVFSSRATDIATGSFAGNNLFVADLSMNTNYALTFGGAAAVSMTPNGRFVAFIGKLTTTAASCLYVWDTQTRARVYTNTTVALSSVGISQDGNHLAYTTSTPQQLWGVDRAGRTNWSIATGTSFRPSLRFSADGRWLVSGYAKTNQTRRQIYLYDFNTRVETLVSHVYTNAATPAASRCEAHDISPDGRFVVYRSAAPSLVPGDTNALSDIFLYDRLTGVNQLVSASSRGDTPADSYSFAPAFSPDGQMLVFQTWASDMLPQDGNRTGHVLAYTLLTAMILPASTPGQGPIIFWPFVPGNAYRVEYKDDWNAPGWQELPGSSSVEGVKAYMQDPQPAAAQRFYRILAF